MKKIFGFLFGLLVISGCRENDSIDFKKSVLANQKAGSLLEWDSSEYHPRRLFKTYRDQQASRPDLGKDICEGLAKLNGQELSLFEEEINNRENAELLKECGPGLKKQLEEYWLKEKEVLQK